MIQGVWFSREPTGYHMKLAMGQAGMHEFSFDSMLVDQRLGRGQQVGPERWAYRDALTGEKFEFHEAFDRSLIVLDE